MSPFGKRSAYMRKIRGGGNTSAAPKFKVKAEIIFRLYFYIVKC